MNDLALLVGVVAVALQVGLVRLGRLGNGRRIRFFRVAADGREAQCGNKDCHPRAIHFVVLPDGPAAWPSIATSRVSVPVLVADSSPSQFAGHTSARA